MLKNVSLIMEKNGKSINALLGDIVDSESSSVTGILYNIELNQEEINNTYKHGLRFNISDGENLLNDCRIFNVDDKYVKFICKGNK